MPHTRLLTTAVVAVALAATLAVGVARADSPPVGPLPAGPTSTIATQKGQLVAVAAPMRGGRVWRIAREIDPRVLVQVGEANVGTRVVLLFRATGPGTATVALALTRGETAKAFEARRFVVRVG